MTKRHSAAVLSDRRFEWYRDDFLQLVWERNGLTRLRHGSLVVDLGCGHGHWGLKMLRTLPPGVRLCGIDRESAWLTQAKSIASRLEVAEQCSFLRATAEHLPLPDDSVDIVTSQTLLMHVADAALVLREAKRVLRPNGWVIFSEPCNLSSQMGTDTANRALSPEEISELAYLFVSCSRGRAAVGRGDDTIGERLPRLLSSQGFHSIQVTQNEKTASIQPPYTEFERAELEQELSYRERRFWLWDRQDAQKLCEAGGGDPGRFARAYAVFERRSEIFRAQVEASTYARGGSHSHYLIVGRV